MCSRKATLIITLLCAFLFNSCNNYQLKDESSKKPKNIILFIGDGMGLGQIYTGLTMSRDSLNISRFNNIGFVKTYSASNYITDSGAAGTAYATGNKTKNGMVGTDSIGNPLKSILEYAEDAGLSTGLVVTSSVTDATPATFIVHVPDRNLDEVIARDYLKNDVDIVVGGGSKYFLHRSDSLNLFDSLISKGYTVVQSLDKLKKHKEGKIYCFTAEEDNPPVLKGRGNMLPEATREAIRLLSSNKRGFFLMVEGSQIDWGGHANDINYVGSEVIDFDKAVGEGLNFAKLDGTTLIIVTADHETGGLSIIGGSLKNRQVEANFATKGHSAIMVPAFAFGPGSWDFRGIYENTDVFKKMKKQLGL